MQRGSLKQIKNRRGVNVWRLQWRDQDGKGRTRILGRVLDMSRADAEAIRRQILAPLNLMVGASRASTVTVREFVEREYLTTVERGWKASTRLTTNQIIETHILSRIGSRPISTITRGELQELLDDIASAGLSRSIANNVRFQCKKIFRFALSDGLVSRDPATGLVAPLSRLKVDRRTATKDELLRGALVLPIRERVIFRLAAFEGMRAGEIVGLQVGDIDNDLIHVRRRIYRGVVDRPKSERSARRLPMTPQTIVALSAYMEILKDLDPSAWLFPSENPDNSVSFGNIFRRSIRPRLASVGLGHLCAQILRRTYVSELPESEKDPHVRAALAGHSVDVSENVYRQSNVDELRRAMKKHGDRLQ